MAAKNQAKPSFWERKNAAFMNFGRAESRPQENFRKYLLQKRKLNLGYWKPINNQLDAIQAFAIKIDELPLPVEMDLDLTKMGSGK